jgi:predicted nucleic acid-binding protein
VDRDVLENAQSMSGSDFEDNLQIACASSANLDAIITRNKDDFEAAPIPVLLPLELMIQLNQSVSPGDNLEEQ